MSDAVLNYRGPNETGGSTPASRRLEPAIVGMALFLMAEVMLFAGLISSCWMARSNPQVAWPPAENLRLPEYVTLTNLGVLLFSGIVIFINRNARINVILATLAGCVFIGVQGFEWAKFIGFAITEANGRFTGLFYGTIAVHALHVLSGVFCLIYGLFKLNQPRSEVRMRVISMYWYLVVLVWPVLYYLLYK